MNDSQSQLSTPPEPVEELDLLDETSLPPEKKARRWPWLLILVILLILGSGIYFSRAKTTATAQTYKTTAVVRGNLVQSVTANGQITPVRTVTVGSQVSGIITAINVDFNSAVTNGQIVAQIDPSTYQQLLIQAEAEEVNAKSALALAQMTFNRNRELYAGKALPKADFESAEIALQQAEATVKSRDAALKKAQVDLERTTIYSPIDGIVISRAVDIGQTVAATMNTPTLFTVAQDLRQMNIEAAVSEADIGGVLEGQAVLFSVDAFPNRTFPGQVTQVRYLASTNQNVVSYSTIVSIHNDDLKLRPSMTANATIITADRKDVLRIPNAALRFKPAEAPARAATAATAVTDGPAAKTVYVMSNGGALPVTLKPVAIKVGANDGAWTEVVSGLNEGDLVVTGSVLASEEMAAKATSNPFGGGMGGPPR